MEYPYPHYRLFVPSQAVGASLVYFDLFNASSSALELEILSVIPLVSGAVAVSGVVAVDLFLTRTTAVGTGGTAATREGTSLTAATFTAMATGAQLNGSVTARLTPTGGATAGAVLSFASVFTEETSAATYYGHTNDLVRRNDPNGEPLIVRLDSGIRVVQGGVASVGNIGFDVIFRTRNR